MKNHAHKVLIVTIFLCSFLVGCESSTIDRWGTLNDKAKAKLIDEDGDGVIAEREACVETPMSHEVTNDGCEVEEEKLSDLVKDIEFQQRSVELSNVQKQELTNYFRELAVNKQWNFIVMGYTSKDGDMLLNEVMAKKRMKIVADFVQERTGLPLSKISTQLIDGDKLAVDGNAQNYESKVENDKDHDGVADDLDQCGNSGYEVVVDSKGCPVFETKEIKKNITVRFNVNSSKIAEIYLPQVKEVAAFINTYNAKKIKVVGHASLVGNESYNLSLSARRANSVVNMLVSEFNIDPSSLESYGKGELSPVVNEVSEYANNLNRRVEIVLSETLKVEKTKELDLLDANALNRKVTLVAETLEMASKQRWHIFMMENKPEEVVPELSEAEAIKEAQESGW
ncbi:hypothetical protein GCM10009128_13680 [Psychrosphaera haliotis]|uniref:OmpA family protein n=1 Tax=Psychrosphaera haliotis TaxID=555083 RepID=UPI0031DCE899